MKKINKSNINSDSLERSLNKFIYNSKNIEEFLIEHKNQLEFMDNMGNGAYIYNYQNGSYSYLSNTICRILGVSKDDILTGGVQVFLNLIHISDIDRVVFLIHETVNFVNKLPEIQREKVITRMYYRLKHNAGSGTWVLQTNRVIRNKSNTWFDLGFLSQLIDSEENHPIDCIISYGDQVKYIHAPENLIKNNLLKFTEKEQEIYDLIKRGLSINQISKSILISESGVRYHRKNILKKLGRKNFIGL